METQVHMDMAHGEIQEEQSKELAEEKQFLKDLHLFMKKRDTPIERIPNLGFKQIDLFVMYKTVRDLGGYHQVTAQQLWKQVYNMLGGNPRSTSAATCTRRHYEKLLLAYECHVRGILMSVLPNHHVKHYHCVNLDKDSGGGRRPAKRRLLSLPLHQNPHNLQPDPHRSFHSMPPYYPHYYHPRHAVLPLKIPITTSELSTHIPPAPRPWFNFPSSYLNTADRVKEPLEQLRSLAEQYKTSSGLAEPLNLSVNAQRQQNISKSYPVSSFAPPPSSKNPKFLNKPSPLYTVHCPQQGVPNEECETQDVEAGSGDVLYSFTPKAREPCNVIDVDAMTASSSPTYSPTLTIDEGVTTMTPTNSNSPQPEYSTIQPKQDREGSPGEVRSLDLSHFLPSIPREDGGKMEIEIPLSVFYNWLRLCGSSATIQGANQLVPPLHSGQMKCSDTDVQPTNLIFRKDPRGSPEDLRLRPRNSPSPTETMSQDRLAGYNPLSSSAFLKYPSSQDFHPFDLTDVHKSYSSKQPPNLWDDVCDAKRSQAMTVDSSQHFAASKALDKDSVQAGKESSSESGPSAVFMVRSGSTSLLHLTTEEVLKLKKIISSSS